MKMLTKYLCCLLLWFGGFSAFAQVTVPDLRCISVDGTEVTLDWVISSDPLGEFTRYEVLLSIGGAAFTNVANLNNRLQNTFTHTSANFDPSKDYRYYIQAQYNDGAIKTTTPSNTLSPIIPNLTVNGNVSGLLTWNNIHTPTLPSSANIYEIDRRFIGMPPIWNNAIANANVGIESFRDTVARCDDEIFYKVRLGDASGCESVSAVVKEALLKSSGPAPMTFNSISVNKDNGNTELTWDKHPEPETVGYYVFYVDANGQEIIIDTVSENTLMFQDLNAQRPANLASQCYRIAAVDSCGKTQGSGTTHCTMHLNRTFDPCEGEVSLTWTPYIGWLNGVKNYEIYYSINGDPFELAGMVSGTDTNFTISNILAINTYAFYITAFESGGGAVSNSNLLGTRFQVVDKPQFIRLRSASIVDTGLVAVSCFVDRKAKFKHIELFRGHSRSGSFKKLKNYVPNNATDSFITIYDSVGLGGQLGAFYVAIVIDECDKPIVKSDTIRTIYLNANGDKFAFETELDWSPLILSDSTLELLPIYYAYYGINGELQSDYFLRTRRVEATTHMFDGDAIYSDEFCYQIEVIQDPTRFYPKSNTSYSSLECFVFGPESEVPTAFTPNDDGINEEWKPEIIYGETGKYELNIYDRWGKIIFTTKDPNEGWDGSAEGGDAPLGSYIYKFTLNTFRESAIERSGEFILLR